MMDDKMNCGTHCISWSAIFVGAFVGIGLGYLLNLFSIAIGLSAFTTSPQGVTAFAVGGFIGFALGTTISMFVGGFAAGWLGKNCCPERNKGALYGFTTWSLALVFIIFLSASAERYVSSNSRLINSTGNNSMMRSMPPQMHFSPSGTSETNLNDINTTVLALFGLSFLAAFASCLGGHYGMTACCKKNLNP